jgi:quinol monooxygenase YgiN
MTEPTTITNKLTLKAEAADEFCAKIPEMIKDTAKRPGFKNIKVFRNTENQIIFIEQWETEQAFKDYIAWRNETGVLAQISAVLDGPRELAFWPTLLASEP